MGECITRLYKCAPLKRKIFSSLEIIFNFFNVAQNFEHKTLYSRTTLFPILLLLEATRLYNLQLSARSKGRRMIVEESKKREKGAYLAYTLLRETRTRTARTKSGSKNARMPFVIGFSRAKIRVEILATRRFVWKNPGFHLLRPLEISRRIRVVRILKSAGIGRAR